jgi:hypothetical protein
MSKNTASTAGGAMPANPDADLLALAASARPLPSHAPRQSIAPSARPSRPQRIGSTRSPSDWRACLPRRPRASWPRRVSRLRRPACQRMGSTDALPPLSGSLTQRYVKRHAKVRKRQETCCFRRFSSPHFALRFRGDFWGENIRLCCCSGTSRTA